MNEEDFAKALKQIEEKLENKYQQKFKEYEVKIAEAEAKAKIASEETESVKMTLTKLLKSRKCPPVEADAEAPEHQPVGNLINKNSEVDTADKVDCSKGAKAGEAIASTTGLPKTRGGKDKEKREEKWQQIKKARDRGSETANSRRGGKIVSKGGETWKGRGGWRGHIRSGGRGGWRGYRGSGGQGGWGTRGGGTDRGNYGKHQFIFY
ncbi:uncharacterized protein [Prorops nasuta]|uniref:uncharacterized protein n=1 Tax=Prorops nasuta TaxID=863751 RepID=UPI0034CDC03F